MRVNFMARSLTFGALLLAGRAAMAITGDGLVGYYPFDGNGNDLGTNNVPVEIVDISTGASSFNGAGKFGQAFQTASDGAAFVAPGGKSDVAEDLTNSDLPKLIGDDTFTLTGWFKFNAIGGQTQTQNHHFIDTDRGASVAGYRISMIAGLSTDGGTTFQEKSFSFSSGQTGPSISLQGLGESWLANQWYFFAGRLDGTEDPAVVWLLPDGESWDNRWGAVAPAFAPDDTAGALRFGRGDPAAPNGAMDGLKDDFSIWNRALSEEEVREIYEAGVNGIALGDLVGPALEGDLNGDGFVGQDDLNIVLGDWGNMPPGDPRADPSGDGFVGQDDLNPVLADWGQGTPPIGGLTAVPEPQALLLALMALAGLTPLCRRAQRRTS